ncbi:MAG: hypothetical protein AAF927_04555 [Bacteroidota bacterium]
MKKFFAALSLLFAAAPLISLHAQNTPQKEISTWFLEERFLIADQNDDALLDIKEMQRFPQEFAYYLTDRHFDLSDNNKDGYLSFNEINLKRRTENSYLFTYHRRQLREIAVDYPLLAQADIKYLKDNPALVSRLFSNLVWMYKQPGLAERIYSDKRWLANHPEAAVALHNNLRWLAAHPSAANQLYRDRSTTQKLPELMAWRSSHKQIIMRMPDVVEMYELEFIPREIIVNR